MSVRKPPPRYQTQRRFAPASIRTLSPAVQQKCSRHTVCPELRSSSVRRPHATSGSAPCSQSRSYRAFEFPSLHSFHVSLRTKRRTITVVSRKLRNNLKRGKTQDEHHTTHQAGCPLVLLIITKSTSYRTCCCEPHLPDLGGIRPGINRRREAIWGRGEWSEFFRLQVHIRKPKPPGSSPPTGS